jgi:multicomponent Na+:H+ antiporter subunit E
MSKMHFYLRERIDKIKAKIETELKYKKTLSRTQKTALTCGILFVYWIILSSSFELFALSIGLLISLGVSIFTYELFTKDIRSGRHLVEKILAFSLLYIPELIFIYVFRLIEANAHVAKNVIFMDITPGIVKIKTDLRSDTGVTALANLITLTPGTLTVDVKGTLEGNTLYVHWIDVKTFSSKRAGDLIKGGLDKWLEKIFW